MASVPPRQRQIKVIIEKDDEAPDGVKFAFKGWPWESKYKREFKNAHHPGFSLDFVIDDDDNTGLLFPKRIERAMWVREIALEDDPCPKDGDKWGQFVGTTVSPDFSTLSVRNFNEFEKKFKFSLNFTYDPENDNSDLICWDPIGDNRNGPAQPFAAKLAVAGLAALGATLAVFAFLGRKR